MSRDSADTPTSTQAESRVWTTDSNDHDSRTPAVAGSGIIWKPDPLNNLDVWSFGTSMYIPAYSQGLP